MGNTFAPVADSCRCMAKTTTTLEISLQLFSTKDKDNDNCLDKCAQLRKGESRGLERGVQRQGHSPGGGESGFIAAQSVFWLCTPL